MIKMTEKRYGLIFKQIREQKQLPLSFFEKVGVKKSNLSKFERGETMMGFERIDTLLQAMDISLAEYELLLNYFTSSYQDEFLLELEKAEFDLNRERLEKLYNESKGSANFLLSLIAKSKTTTLSSKDVQKIFNYLDKLAHWGYFELSLLQALLDNFLDNTEMKNIIKIIDVFEDKINNYQEIFKYRRKIYQIAYQAILVFSAKGEYKLAKRIEILTAANDRKEFDFFISNLRNLALGFMEYQLGDKEAAQTKMEQSLYLMEHLGSRELRRYYETKINIFASKEPM